VQRRRTEFGFGCGPRLVCVFVSCVVRVSRRGLVTLNNTLDLSGFGLGGWFSMVVASRSWILILPIVEFISCV
jgi:hypothetical protein